MNRPRTKRDPDNSVRAPGSRHRKILIAIERYELLDTKHLSTIAGLSRKNIELPLRQLFDAGLILKEPNNKYNRDRLKDPQVYKRSDSGTDWLDRHNLIPYRATWITAGGQDTNSNEAIAVSRITQTIKSVCSNQGRDMKFVTGLLAAVVLLAGVGASHAVVRIADDRGGRIGTYVKKYYGLRSSGEAVVIDGLCASACTIVLSAVPHNKICVTSRATLGFHAAWDFGTNGRTITDREATMMLYTMYPMPVRRWIAARGGLTPHMIFLRGKVLQAMYKPCFLDARHYFAVGG